MHNSLYFMTLLIYLQRVGAAVPGAVMGAAAGLSNVGTSVAAAASIVISKALFQQ